MMMSLGSVPAVPPGSFGLDSVLRDSAEGRGCEWAFFLARLRILMSRMTSRRMSKRKMMQPAPMTENIVTLELRMLSELPEEPDWSLFMWSRERNKKREGLGTEQKLLGWEAGSEKGSGI